MHMYNRITLLYTRNYHNVVNQPYSNENSKKKRERYLATLQAPIYKQKVLKNVMLG